MKAPFSSKKHLQLILHMARRLMVSVLGLIRLRRFGDHCTPRKNRIRDTGLKTLLEASLPLLSALWMALILFWSVDVTLAAIFLPSMQLMIGSGLKVLI